ncbi:uncharacterized protein LOC142318825 isoform X3 [Lycorma delicatula]|uniref:uncharacterized protein LOC142318825 isoform X3 n=1 Tax=Lycorma delicatula TaxID=130591 RepID=UPI003F5165F4
MINIGLEKDAKRLDNLGVKDGETSSDTGKKKGKEERPPTKVVVRRLPPTMTEEEFLQQIDPIPSVDYMYYVPADTSLMPHSFCRAYLNFVNQSDIFIFTQKFDGYVFVDSKGMEYPAVVEFAPFQRIPKQRPGRKKDPKAGTLENDVMYTSFLEKLQAQIQESTSAGSNMKQHFFETNVSSNEENKVNSTPLLDYLRTRHAERLRAREEKRKKDLERKKARDEQRRSSKKPEEEPSVVKPPVVSMKPKTEDERLMEQQTIFLRKLLGLPNPCNSVIQQSCNEIVEDLSSNIINSCAESVVSLVSGSNKLSSSSRGDFKVKESFYSNYVSKYNHTNTGKSKYSLTNRNGDVKTYSANGYWKRETFYSEGSRNRKLWKNPETRYDHSARLKMNISIKPVCNTKWKDTSMAMIDKQDTSLRSCEISKDNCNKVKGKEYSLEKELLDESALEAFPTFEESKLHKLQKNILKAPLIQTSPIKKETVEAIKMKFQMWSHDVTTKAISSNKKKDLKKNDSAQVRIMKPPSRFIRNGINRMMRENDESRLELIYESIMEDDMKDVLNNKSDNVGMINNMRCSGDGVDYFSDNYKKSVKDCSVNEAVTHQGKNNYSDYNYRFLISNNVKPKAFGSGRKVVPHNFCHTSNHNAKSDSSPNDGLPKAFNSLLATENNQNCNCHQSHRNENIIGSSKGSSSTSNINRKGSPCSIIC